MQRQESILRSSRRVQNRNAHRTLDEIKIENFPRQETFHYARSSLLGLTWMEKQITRVKPADDECSLVNCSGAVRADFMFEAIN